MLEEGGSGLEEGGSGLVSNPGERAEVTEGGERSSKWLILEREIPNSIIILRLL